MNKSFIRPLADLSLMYILRAASTTLTRSLSVIAVCDSWASASRKDLRDKSMRVPTDVRSGIHCGLETVSLDSEHEANGTAGHFCGKSFTNPLENASLDFPIVRFIATEEEPDGRSL